MKLSEMALECARHVTPAPKRLLSPADRDTQLWQEWFWLDLALREKYGVPTDQLALYWGHPNPSDLRLWAELPCGMFVCGRHENSGGYWPSLGLDVWIADQPGGSPYLHKADDAVALAHLLEAAPQPPRRPRHCDAAPLTLPFPGQPVTDGVPAELRGHHFDQLAERQQSKQIKQTLPGEVEQLLGKGFGLSRAGIWETTPGSWKVWYEIDGLTLIMARHCFPNRVPLVSHDLLTCGPHHMDPLVPMTVTKGVADLAGVGFWLARQRELFPHLLSPTARHFGQGCAQRSLT